MFRTMTRNPESRVSISDAITQHLSCQSVALEIGWESIQIEGYKRFNWVKGQVDSRSYTLSNDCLVKEDMELDLIANSRRSREGKI